MTKDPTIATAPLGIIGGTGLDRLELVDDRRGERPATSWGVPSGALVHGTLDGRDVVFLPRHGRGHDVAPHEINYRANLRALADAGVGAVVGVAAVGAIADAPPPGGIAVPDQLIDYTCGRGSSFFEGPGVPVEHVDFGVPYTPRLRERILAAARSAGVAAVDGGCYGAVQGPRLETAAEIRRMGRDGCTLVGMTGMPEAVLARELGLDYACCAVVANPAAGKGAETITMAQIRYAIATGMDDVRALLRALVADGAD